MLFGDSFMKFEAPSRYSMISLLFALVITLDFQLAKAQTQPTEVIEATEAAEVQDNALIENYEERYYKESLRLEKFFDEEVAKIQATYVLARFIAKYSSAKEYEVTCNEFGSFHASLNAEEQEKLIEEMKSIFSMGGAQHSPFRYKNNPHISVNFYEKSQSRIINFLELISFSLEQNLNWRDIYARRNSLFINDYVKVEYLSFCGLRDSINLKRWGDLFYLELLRKIRIQVVDLLKDASQDFEAVKDSLFLPPEIFDGPQKLLFALNTCVWSDKSVMLADKHEMVKYQDYALMHMKEIVKYLNKDSQVVVGYVHDYNFAHNLNFLTREQSVELLAKPNDFDELETGLQNSKSSCKGYTEQEAISGLYKSTFSQKMDFNYALFFTDGYAKTFNEELKALNLNPKTVFLFKGMCPECGTYDRYISKVARSGKDIILDKKYYSPHYKEYFDRKMAMESLQNLLVKIDGMISK